MFHSYVCLPEGVSFLFVERMWKHGGKAKDLTLPDVLLEEMKTGGKRHLWSPVGLKCPLNGLQSYMSSWVKILNMRNPKHVP